MFNIIIYYIKILSVFSIKTSIALISDLIRFSKLKSKRLKHKKETYSYLKYQMKIYKSLFIRMHFNLSVY